MKFLLSQLDTITPTPVVAHFVEKYTPRSVLDVGTGTGRNAIYLAQKGFIVTALDRDTESIAELQSFAQREQLPLTAIITHLKTYTPDFSNYNAVIFSNIFHYLKYNRATTLLQIAMSSAKIGDTHLISAITTNGDFYHAQPNAYYPKLGQLREYYEINNWHIVEYKEIELPARMKNTDGSPMRNIVAQLIAEKK
jgi:tellurite methyltransferase